MSYVSATIAASIIRNRQRVQWQFRKRWKAIPTWYPTKRGFISRSKKKNQISRRSQSLTNISRFPPFNVPTNTQTVHDITIVTFSDMFRHHNAIFQQYTPNLKPIEINLITSTNLIAFRIFCCWEKEYLIHFRTHDIMYLLIYEVLKHTSL